MRASQTKAMQALDAMRQEQERERASLQKQLAHSRQIVQTLAEGRDKELQIIADDAADRTKHTREMFGLLMGNETKRIAELEKDLDNIDGEETDAEDKKPVRLLSSNSG